MTKIIWTHHFKKEYQALPNTIKTRIKKQLQIFQQNAHHPSLHTKKMNAPGEIWEGRITKSYRFTYQVEGDTFILRRVGTHDILKNP